MLLVFAVRTDSVIFAFNVDKVEQPESFYQYVLTDCD